MSIKLELENVGCFRGKREFFFRKGLNVIYAPNASGKTSILAGLKAISIPGLTHDELRRVLNDYEERGRVRLILDGHDYAIELLRGSDDSVEALGKTLSDNGVVKTVAFVDLENRLVNAVYSGREEGVVEIIREVTGVTHIEDILAALGSLESTYEHKYDMKREGYEKAKQEVESQIRDIEDRLGKIREKIIEIRRDPSLGPIRKELEDIETEREKIEKALREKRAEEVEVSNRIGLIERDYSVLEVRLKVLREDLEKLEKERRTLREKYVEVRVTIEKLEDEIRSLSSERERYEREARELEDLLKRRREVLNYARCPYCGAEISRERLLSEIQELESKVSEVDGRMKELEEELSAKRREIAELRGSTEERLKTIEDKISELVSEVRELEVRLGSMREEKEKLSKRLSDIKRDMEINERELRVLKERLIQLSEKAPIINTLRKLEEEEEYLTKNIDYLYGRMRQLDDVYKEVRVLEEWLEKTRLLKEYFEMRLNELSVIVVNRINEEMSKHFKLLKLAELEYPVMRKDFTLRVVRTGGTQSSLSELSDAEKAIFTILLTLTLKDYVAPDFPIYVIDGLIELIDETRIKEVLQYLQEQADERLVVVVTKNKPFTGEPKEVSQEDIFMNAIPPLG